MTLKALDIHTRAYIKDQHLQIETEQCMITKKMAYTWSIQ